MKSLSKLILLFALVAVAFTAELHEQATVQADSSEKKIEAAAPAEESKFGKMIQTMLQISAGKEVDYNPLFKALEGLIASLTDKRKTEEKDFNEASLAFGNLKENLDKAINDLSSTVVNSKQKIENVLKPAVTTYESAIETGKRNLEETIARRDKATSERNIENAQFQKNTKESREAIEAVDEALTVMASLRSGGSSLAEVKRETVKDLMGEIKDKTVNIKGFEFAPLINALLEVALNQNFVDKEAAQQVVTLLNKIRKNLVNLIREMEENETKAVDTYNKLIETLANEEKGIEKKLSDDKTNLFKTQDDIKFTEKLIVACENLKVKLTNSLEEQTKIFDQRKLQNQQLLEQFDRELALVRDAIKTLNSGGIRKGHH